MDDSARAKVDQFVRGTIDSAIPSRESVYEYFVSGQKWTHWEEAVRRGRQWMLDPAAPFYKLIVPTIDTYRYAFLLRALVAGRCATLVTGPVGTGKTSVIEGVCEELKERHAALTINMSARISSRDVQNTIESRMEKRLKGVYQPIGGGRMILFLDDFNMPQKDAYGSQVGVVVVHTLCIDA